MNCRKAERFLPLLASGDLPDRQARRTALHLEVCKRCRAMERGLAQSRLWLERDAAPPLGQAEYAALRRAVWREIEARGTASTKAFPNPGRLAFAGAGLFAAAVAVFLASRRGPGEAGPHSPAPAHALVSPASPAPREPRREEIESLVPSPLAVVASRRPPRLPRSRTAHAGESGVDRIEFRTANPNVRIIWLVKKGEETSSALTTGRVQEVS